MKFKRTNIFIAVSSVALLFVLVIQVNWIIQSAKIKEEIFNEKANMVVAKTAEVLSADPQACRDFDDSVNGGEMEKTDSLVTSYMQFYDLTVPYSFEVSNPNENTWNEVNKKNAVYKKRLEEEVSRNGLELNLILPARKQFIVKEMSTMFITSVILILVVLLMFWRTIMLLMKEKLISEHTTDFLNNMTHEFKTPITNISLAGRMIEKDSASRQDERIKHYSGIILEENEKLRQQVEQVLSMTALERGEIPIRKEELNFHELIENSLKYINLQLENRNGKLDLELDAENSFVMGDSMHLMNAFRNLVDNAIKYSKGEPEITISTYNNESRLMIVVSDKGIGIEKEHHKKVFDKFFRVPTGDVHDVKGFGLGLAYLKKIVELHGGTITLQSEKDKGSTFTIALPYV